MSRQAGKLERGDRVEILVNGELQTVTCTREVEMNCWETDARGVMVDDNNHTDNQIGGARKREGTWDWTR